MAAEACRIGILLRAPGVVDVGAPMKHKGLCYGILRDARTVLQHAPAPAFQEQLVQPGASLVITMDMAGRVDLAAPLPNRELCHRMLDLAKGVIERYDDAEAPALRPFASVLAGTP